MTGDTHCLVATLALARLSTEERSILAPRWEAIEAGATLSDHFRIMWEPAEPSDDKKQLVHRCYVDSADPKDHGCVTRALDHAEGSIASMACQTISAAVEHTANVWHTVLTRTNMIRRNWSTQALL